MKVSQLRDILMSAQDLYRGSDSAPVADSINSFIRLCEGREMMTVSTFANLIAKSVGNDDCTRK